MNTTSVTLQRREHIQCHVPSEAPVSPQTPCEDIHSRENDATSKVRKPRWADMEDDDEEGDDDDKEAFAVCDSQCQPCGVKIYAIEGEENMQVNPGASSSTAALPPRTQQQQQQQQQQQHHEEQGQEEEFGELLPKMRPSPQLPSLDEQRRHVLTHLPYRAWCRHCVAARKANFGHHYSKPKGPINRPEVHMDYCFPRNEVGGTSVPVVVIKDRDSRALAAHVVPAKGGDQEWSVDRVCRDLLKWGIRSDVTWVTIRCDQESALQDFAQEVAKKSSDGNRCSHLPGAQCCR